MKGEFDLYRGEAREESLDEPADNTEEIIAARPLVIRLQNGLFNYDFAMDAAHRRIPGTMEQRSAA